VVGRRTGSRSRLANDRHSRPMPSARVLSQDHRAFRLGRGVGAQADTGMGGYRRGYGHSLPDNVRRYYIPSTTHGGANTAAPNTMFSASLAGSLLPLPNCREWVMEDVAPPPSRYPTLSDGNLVGPTKAAMGFPTIPMSVVCPGWRTSVPEPGFINPMLDYDRGPDFNAVDASGVPTLLPPPIKHVIKMLVPRVNADGNEMGGVPVVLNEAPLGTYLGWNITDARRAPSLAQYRPFHGGQLCDYIGGMIPFGTTKAERDASGDPRPSLEERHGGHEAPTPSSPRPRTATS
jgi:alpha/beta hydrolase family protein